jgi:hypothetical protein
MVLKFNKTCSEIRIVKIGQSSLENQTLQFYQRDLHKTYSIYF